MCERRLKTRQGRALQALLKIFLAPERNEKTEKGFKIGGICNVVLCMFQKAQSSSTKDSKLDGSPRGLRYQ